MKRTGEILQKAREEKNLSLNEIALSLKINSKVLSAIETGDLSKLPAKTFLRGFVQSYANYLKIDTEKVMELFAEEMGGTRPVPASEQGESPEGAAAVTEPAPVAHREEPVLSEIAKRNNTKLFVITGICLVLVCLIFVTARIVDRYQKETITEEVQVSSPLPESSDGEPEAPLTEESSEDVADTSETKTSSPPSAASAAASPVSAPAPSPAAVPVTSEKATPPPAPAANPPEPAPAPPEPPKIAEAEKKPAASRPLEMIIEALDNVEIEYGSASGSLRKVQLGPDRVHTIRSREGLRLNISNGGAVNLNLNGRDLGVPGDLGKPVKLSY